MLRIASSPYGRSASRVVLVLALAAAATLVMRPTPAYAATSLTVTTTADVATNFAACGNAGITMPSVPLSLREATCLANNIGGVVTISIPAGTYNLGNR